MWFVVSKKRYEREIDGWIEEENSWLEHERNLEGTVAEQTKVLKSTEREKVLADLQSALNLMRSYQRSLSTMSASDPQIVEANALLEKYGMQGEPAATYLGFQRKGAVHEPRMTHEDRIELEALLDPPTVKPTEPPKTRWEREEEEYGDEAYGKGNVRIDAEAIDEGDDKEPGYTRARIHFVDVDAEPAALTEAKNAGWSPPNDVPADS